MSCTQTKYSSRHDANVALSSLRRRNPDRASRLKVSRKCPRCGGWHLVNAQTDTEGD